MLEYSHRENKLDHIDSMNHYGAKFHINSIPIIILLVTFVIFDSYLNSLTHFSLFAEVSFVLLLFLALVNGKKIQTQNYLTILSLLMFSISVIILFYRNMYISSSFSVAFEYFKLFAPFSLCLVLNSVKRNDYYVTRLMRNILNVVILFLLINLAVVIVQYMFGVGIVSYLGIEVADIQLRNERVTGITYGANEIGDFGLLAYIFFHILMQKSLYKVDVSQRIIKSGIFLSISLVMLSSSKHAILLLIIYLILFNLRSLKTILKFVPVIFIAGALILYFDLYGVWTKLSYYSGLIQLADQAQYIDPRFLEVRARNIIRGIVIINDNFPFGTGLGTWGDFSKTFNPNSPFEVQMSDSYIFHILVEQGVLSVFYFLFLWSLLKHSKSGIILFLILFPIFIMTMGISSGTWPIMISIIVIESNRLKQLKNKIVTV